MPEPIKPLAGDQDKPPDEYDLEAVPPRLVKPGGRQGVRGEHYWRECLKMGARQLLAAREAGSWATLLRRDPIYQRLPKPARLALRSQLDGLLEPLRRPPGPGWAARAALAYAATLYAHRRVSGIHPFMLRAILYPDPGMREIEGRNILPDGEDGPPLWRVTVSRTMDFLCGLKDPAAADRAAALWSLRKAGLTLTESARVLRIGGRAFRDHQAAARAFTRTEEIIAEVRLRLPHS